MTDPMACDGEGWATQKMVCGICGHKWVAVYPIPTKTMECYACGHFEPTSFGQKELND